MLNNPLCINISTDHVYWYCNGVYESVPYRDLERTLPGLLHKSVRKEKPSCFVVLNGPGGFTALRIGALTISMIAKEYAIPLYDWSKPAFFRHVVAAGGLPPYGRISIGQRNNMWLYDFTKDAYQEINIQSLVDETMRLPAAYFIDHIEDHAFLRYLDAEKVVTLFFAEDGVSIGDVLLSWNVLCDEAYRVETLQPHYMIEPTLS